MSVGKMKIIYVGFKNIMGVDELEFQPGKINVIEGKNGKGKTSVIRAIQAAVGGGHDATLLRNGETEGEVVLVFDNGYRLEKNIGTEKSEAILKDGQGRKVKRAASLIKDMIDGVGLNPVKILTASPKDRVKYLLDAVQMETPFDVIEGATGLQISRDDTRHPMQIIDENRNHFYEERTETNRLLKEKKVVVSKMRGTIPFRADGTDWKAVGEKLVDEKQRVEMELQNSKDAAQVLFEREVERLRATMEARINAIRKEHDDLIGKAMDKSDVQKNEAQDKAMPLLMELTEKISDARSNHDASAKVAGAQEYVEKGEAAIKEMEKDSEFMTHVIDQLDLIKADLLKNLPIAGLEVREGEIYLDGVAFDSVNKSKRVRFALTIAGLRDSQVPIVCVDDLETLDSESFSIFQAEAAKTGMQFFVTRVTDNQELTVNTEIC